MINYSFSMDELEYFMLIFCRVSCLIYAVPFFSMNNTPRRVRVGLSFVVTLLLYYAMLEKPVLVYSTLLEYAVLVLREAIVGLLMGFACNICTTVVGFAGRIIDMETGLSMASLMDPTTRENMSITGMIYNYAIMLILIITGIYEYIMKALNESFQLIPIGGAVLNSDRLLDAMLKFMADYVLIAFRICLPMFAVMIVLNALLGILAKVAPQMNMFAVGMQMKVLIGLSLLFLTMTMLPGISDLIYTEIKTMVVAFVEAMM
ncbi:MAG: flagellar biosynthetic protein FliR [Lachnospiraceae bacterium]|nr:flagellar biosynthetic protein FliR [Lachnospiraceae bacterium]